MVRDSCLWEGGERKIITVLEGSQASPARPSDMSSIKIEINIKKLES